MIERAILREMIRSEAFSRKVVPHLKKEYFKTGEPERVVYEIVDGYVRRYNALPASEALAVELSNRLDLSEDLFKDSARLMGELVKDEAESPQLQWLVDQTEGFCQDRALNIALSKAIEILADKGERGVSKGAIPKLMQDALSVTFDTRVGHDYLEEAMERYDLYHDRSKRFPTDLALLNKALKGGWAQKTLNVVMAVAGAGKTLFMCHDAANNLMAGRNVLYVTLEVSEHKIGQRIDANLMGVDMSLLESLPKDVYEKKVASIRSKTTGRLVIKEYAPVSAGAAHFRHLLNELKTKQGFIPDLVYVDYINICAPTTLGKGEHNSYERVKRIAEELRGLAVEHCLPLITATQTNRTGYKSSDVGMENTSDSLGLPMTADWFAALIATEELDKLGQYLIQQLKSRYDDINRMRRFYVGVDKPKMRLFNLESSAQDLPPDPPAVRGSGGFTGFY